MNKVAFTLAALSCVVTMAAEAVALRLDGTTMGTSYRVDVADVPAGVTEDSLRDGVERVLTRIERQMSTYRSDSELSRFNDSDSTAWVTVSEDTATVVATALHVSRVSGGAFDVTVGPLVELWGFGVDRRSRHRPSAQALSTALARVGFERLEARLAPPALRKQRPDLTVDLSAIAKGFGVDRVADHLQAAGIGNYLIDIGGELRGRGRGPRGAEWSVAIEQPGGGGTAAMSVVRLDDAAIATSGTYRSYFDEGGQLYSHIIDPRTGMPVTHALASVSVIAPTTMRADALATAVLVLGPDEGLRLADKEGLAALLVVRSDKGFQARRTQEFARYEMRDGS